MLVGDYVLDLFHVREATLLAQHLSRWHTQLHPMLAGMTPPQGCLPPGASPASVAVPPTSRTTPFLARNTPEDPGHTPRDQPPQTPMQLGVNTPLDTQLSALHSQPLSGQHGDQCCFCWL